MHECFTISALTERKGFVQSILYEQGDDFQQMESVTPCAGLLQVYKLQFNLAIWAPFLIHGG